MRLTRRQLGFASLALLGAWGAAAEEDDDGVPNVFISPHGEPFRAGRNDPYPVSTWFSKADRNGDGKLDRPEFVADADRFFKTLDINGDGVLGHREVALYENNIAPEILGARFQASAGQGGRLWLAQIHSPEPIDPGGDGPDTYAPPHREHLDESGQGAAPYSLFAEPEPILTADFNVDGVIRKENFLKLADMHFDALDTDKKHYITLSQLPRTTVQKLVEKGRRGRRGA